MSQKSFAQRRGIALSTLQWWIAKLRHHLQRFATDCLVTTVCRETGSVTPFTPISRPRRVVGPDVQPFVADSQQSLQQSDAAIRCKSSDRSYRYPIDTSEPITINSNAFSCSSLRDSVAENLLGGKTMRDISMDIRENGMSKIPAEIRRLSALTLLVTALGSGACTPSVNTAYEVQADTVQPQINVYVANANNNTVSVIDTASNTITATIPVGRAPVSLALTPDAAFLYVVNDGANTVSVVATVTNTVVATVTVGSAPFGIAVTPDGRFMYVTNLRGNSISVIDTASNTVVATIPVGRFPEGVAITPDGAFAYAVNDGDNNVSVIDTATNTVVTTVPVGNVPGPVAVSPDGALVYVGNIVTPPSTGGVSVIATATNTVTASVATSNQPFGIAFTPNGAFAYVANFVGSSVSVIDTATTTVTATISDAQARTPAGVAITPDGAFAYTVNFNSNTVSAIDTATNTIVAIIPGLVGPEGIAITPARRNRAPNASCHDVTVAAGPSCTATASVDNGSSDPDGDALTLSQDPAPPYSLGATSVTLTATDSSGASGQCTATVTVVDNTPPTITCPADITTRGNIPNSPFANVDPGTPTTTDNCAGLTVAGTRSDGQPLDAPYPFGTTTITRTATDAGGNQSSCQQTITVVPNTPANKDECKHGGWQSFTNPTFDNQGHCVSFVEHLP